MTRPTAISRKDQTASPFDTGLNILFLAAFPLVLLLFQGSIIGILSALVQLGLFALALRLISKGQKLHAAYDAAEVARRPRLPRKILGSFLIGVLVMILAAHHFVAATEPLALGGFATLLSLAAFGLDPLRDKGMNDPGLVHRQRAEQHAARIERSLDAIVDQVALLGDADLTRQTEAVRCRMMGLVRALSSDVRDLRRIQKPLDKFLDLFGAECHRLCEAWETDDQFFARRRYVAKIAVLSEAFEAKARQCRTSENGDEYDLEADLLIDRMQRRPAA